MREVGRDKKAGRDASFMRVVPSGTLASRKPLVGEEVDKIVEIEEIFTQNQTTNHRIRVLTLVTYLNQIYRPDLAAQSIYMANIVRRFFFAWVFSTTAILEKFHRSTLKICRLN